MGIFKKADAEIRVQIFREGNVANGKVSLEGGKTNLIAGFESICRALLETVSKERGEVVMAAFAKDMEEALKRSIEQLGVKSLDEMLEEALPTLEKMLGAAMKYQESGEADV